MSSRVVGFEGVRDVPRSMLVSATYDGVAKAAILKFYEPQSGSIILWKDTTGHKPYCYSDLTPQEIGVKLGQRSDIIDVSQADLRELSTDRSVTMSKITVDDPLAIGGTSGNKSIRNIINTWESDIKYYENYLYDNRLIVGKYYSIQNGRIQGMDEDIAADVKLALKSLLWDRIADEDMVDKAEFQEFISVWANLLNQPIPTIRRLALDIEVDSEEGRIPDPRIAEKRVTAVGFDGTGNFSKVFVLDTNAQRGSNELDPRVEVVFYADEKKMLEDTFKVISDFPFLLTYNGDDFDLPYLYYRARVLGIPDEANPLYMMKNSATLRRGVHIDLYRTMSNRSFQIYVFSAKYTTFSLNEVAKAVLNEQKIDYGKSLGDLTLYETANYCWNDARITLKLTTFDSDLLMNLLVIICRIGRMPIDDIARLGVSQWIRSLLYYEHRRIGALIPQQEELKKRSLDVASDAVIKDKKYRGGLVIEPVEGVHFGVVVMDFASLYPSIIKVKNLSYETVRCPHPECRDNAIPQTKHWVCGKRNGITSLIIGSLRELRVNYYKALSKSKDVSGEDRRKYFVITQALKVILNASYGVMGAEIFPLYFLPAAEATTAVGRHTIMETTKICKEAGIEVLYGDSVVGSTPITVKSGRRSRALPIEALYGAAIQGMSVWTDGGFQRIVRVYRHRVRKKIYRILTRTGMVECTEDHSIIIDGKRVRPSDLGPGQTLNQFPQKLPGLEIPKRAAWWCGYVFAAAGRRPRQRLQLTIGGAHGLLCLEGQESKAMPGAGAAAQRAFAEGMSFYDDAKDRTAWFEQNDYCTLHLVAAVLQAAGIRYELEADGEKDRIGIRPVQSPGIPHNQIKEISARDADEYVYDIETANHHFCGGIGNILLHNTDSLFLKNPAPEQVRMVIETAKQDHGVELEIDKEYRYCVLSSRKKNYFGVSKEGRVDVKGMTGKKSHTPPFIKDLFYEITGVLATVGNQEEFEAAQKSISSKIAGCAKRLEDRAIPIKELAFNVMMSKDLVEYKKTIPQHVRAAKLMDDADSIRRGKIISYVKTNNRIGVKPVDMARPGDIDSEKYLEFMESTLDQITSPLNMDFDTILNKPKQTGLDQFFWS